MIKLIAAGVVVLSSCIAQPQYPRIMTMPYQLDDPGVRAGCVRTLARLVVESGAYALWPMDRIYVYCDEIERSYYEERRPGGRRIT